MKAVGQFFPVAVLLLSGQTFCDGAGSSKPQSIEMRAALVSECLEPKQKTQSRQDLLPVQLVYARIQRIDDKVTTQYWRFDRTCKSVSTGSGNWTTGQFASAIGKLRSTGARNRDFLAPGESSGEDLPISFLKVRSPGFSFDAYTMWLRLRWTGEMKTDDPVTAKVLGEWKALLQQATPEESTRSGIEAIKQIADNCADGWPPDIKSWVCAEAQQSAHQ